MLHVCMFEVPCCCAASAGWRGCDGGEAADLGPDAGHEAGLPGLPGLNSPRPQPPSLSSVRLADVRAPLCRGGGSQEKREAR